jgi:hypothetical protein
MGILAGPSKGQIDFDFGAATLAVADGEPAGSVRVQAGYALLGYGNSQAG